MGLHSLLVVLVRVDGWLEDGVEGQHLQFSVYRLGTKTLGIWVIQKAEV